MIDGDEEAPQDDESRTDRPGACGRAVVAISMIIIFAVAHAVEALQYVRIRVVHYMVTVVIVTTRLVDISIDDATVNFLCKMISHFTLTLSIDASRIFDGARTISIRCALITDLCSNDNAINPHLIDNGSFFAATDFFVRTNCAIYMITFL